MINLAKHQMMLPDNKRTQAFPIILLVVLVNLLISSCSTIKTNQEKEDDQSDVWYNNCAGYTLNYTNKVNEERDSVTIYGRVSDCSSNKAIHEAEICFYGINDSVKFRTKTDNKGYYEIKVTIGHYRRIQADYSRGSLTIPEVDLGTVGDAGGAMNIDMRLLRQYLLNQPISLTRKDIRQIKKNRKQNKVL